MLTETKHRCWSSAQSWIPTGLMWIPIHVKIDIERKPASLWTYLTHSAIVKLPRWHCLSPDTAEVSSKIRLGGNSNPQSLTKVVRINEAICFLLSSEDDFKTPICLRDKPVIPYYTYELPSAKLLNMIDENEMTRREMAENQIYRTLLPNSNHHTQYQSSCPATSRKYFISKKFVDRMSSSCLYVY